MRILLLGGSGQLGWELRRSLADLGDVTAPGRDTCDLGHPDELRATMRAVRPALIVNSAAYTAVDRAEEERDAAFAVNAHAPGVLAEEARRLDAVLVHYSTDYVFDGEQAGAYREEDTPRPVNVYGASKLAGERAIAASGCRHLVLRTSWVYGARRANFFLTMRRLAWENRELRVVADQYGVPNWTRVLAEASAAILVHGAPAVGGGGIYHLSARGRTSWHGFAQAIMDVDHDGRVVVPIHSEDYPLPARRPANSVLDTGRLERDFGLVLPDWDEVLDRFVRERDEG